MSVSSTAINILSILQIALAALAAVPGVGADAAVVNALVQIIQKAMLAYEAATGAPLDLTKVPIESPVQ